MHRRREDEEVVDVDVGEEREKGSGVGGTAVELPRATPLAGRRRGGGAHQPLKLVVERAHVADEALGVGDLRERNVHELAVGS